MAQVFVEIVFKKRAEDGRVYLAPAFIRTGFEHVDFVLGKFQSHRIFKQAPVKVVYALVVASRGNAGFVHFMKEAANQIVRTGFLFYALFNDAAEDFIGQQPNVFGKQTYNALQGVMQGLLRGYFSLDHTAVHRGNFFCSQLGNILFVLTEDGRYRFGQ